MAKPGSALLAFAALALAACVGPGLPRSATASAGSLSPLPSASGGPSTGSEPSTVAASPVVTRTARATESPVQSATAAASGEPSAGASADADVLDLEVTSCEGGVVLRWSPSDDPAFHHYTALRSPDREIAPDYPPIAPAVDWGDTYATDRYVTSAADASIIPTERTWFYRVMAYDAAGAVIGTSPVRAARLHDVERLGPVRASPSEESRTVLRWEPYNGFSRCFSHYRVLYGMTGTPSTVLAVVSGQASSRLVTDALDPGQTYQLRIQAVRATTLNSFVVGETEVTSYTVP